MSRLRTLLSKVLALFGIRHRDHELREEIETHLESLAAEHVRRGLTSDAARAAARREFGGIEQMAEAYREQRALRILDSLTQDVRYAVRTLQRSPRLVIVAVISLALGIGANAFVFSTLRALLLRPLPIRAPGDVFFLQALPSDNHSYLNYVDFRDRAADFASLAAYRVAQAAVDTGSGATSSWGYLATGNYFDMLGLRPTLGRFFTASEDVGRNVAPYVVVSYDYWTNALGSDPAVLGRLVRINGHGYTLLGVAPKGFLGTEVFFRPDFWIPMTMATQLEGRAWIESRRARNVYVVGRLRRGVPWAQAEATFTAVAARLVQEHPEANRQLRIGFTTPGLFGDVLRAPARAFMTVTLVLALLVLTAACANLASLLAARALDRLRELAVRLSLGATRYRVARQLFVETLLLCVCGGVAGLAVAWVLLDALTQWRPPVGDLPLALDVTPDAAVVGFAALISTGAAVLAVGAAVRRAWLVNPSVLTRGATAGARLGRWNAREVLLGVQMALCSLLVISCLVSIHGVRRTLDTPLGFNPDGVIVASFDLHQVGHDRTQGTALRTRILESVRALPGVDGATFTSSIPLTTDQSRDTIVADTAAAESDGTLANSFTVPPGYFGVMQTRLIEGREFSATDRRAVIINETLARRLFGTHAATGRRIKRQQLVEIVGVTQDGKYAMPGEAPRPAVYWLANEVYVSSTHLLIRTSLPPSQIVPSIRKAIADLDPALPIVIDGSLRDVTSLAFVPAAAAAVILGAFGALAIALAATGIYGLAAYSVSARTKEIGIRAAVGGHAHHILRALLGRTATVTAAGTAVGIVLAIAANSLLTRVVYQASSRDPIVIVTTASVMMLLGLVAVWAPARGVVRLNPTDALRCD